MLLMATRSLGSLSGPPRDTYIHSMDFHVANLFG